MSIVEIFEEVSNSSKSFQDGLKAELRKIGEKENCQDYIEFVILLMDGYILERGRGACMM